LKYKVSLCFSMVDSQITSGRDGVLEASVIRSEIRSRAELNCALPLPLFLHPSHQRDTAHRPIGTGWLRTRRRFGYRGSKSDICAIRVSAISERAGRIRTGGWQRSERSGGLFVDDRNGAPTPTRQYRMTIIFSWVMSCMV
jgi:hypothetical protein